MWKYQSMLSPIAAKYRLNLGEGQTPLVKSRFIGRRLGLNNLYFKLENLNPTGSYKDRFAAMFVSKMQSRGQKLCIATSSGNTGAALSAYSAAAGIRCVLAIVDGAPLAKIKQMQLYGAQTIMVEDFGKNTAVTNEVFDLLHDLTKKIGVPLPVSAYHYCAEGMEGVQTIAYEILEKLKVQHIFSPAGGGGLTLAVAKGALMYGEKKGLTELPKVHCVQPQGNDTIASALRNNALEAQEIEKSTTKVSGLQVPSILDGDAVIETCRLLRGTGFVVEDADVFDFQKQLAQKEGIFSEPAGAVALAGLALAVKNKEVLPDDKIVCLITGSGFKDMLSVETHFGLPDVERIKSGFLHEHILTTDWTDSTDFH